MIGPLTKYTSRTEALSVSVSTVLCSEVKQMALSSKVNVELEGNPLLDGKRIYNKHS